MNKLNVNGWKWFKLAGKGGLFNAEKSKNVNSEIAEENIGDDIPYITRTEFNNGCKFFTCKNNFKLEKGNCITIGGEGAVIFYQPIDFISGNNITKIYHPKMTENIGLFVVSILKLERYRYTYNRAFNQTHVENTYLKLPIDDNGNPNWEFMENYIKELRLREKESNELAKKFQDESKDVKLKLNIINWKWFKLKELFKKQKIKKYSSSPEEEGPIPYITSKSNNNGVDLFVNEIPSFNKKCLTISTNGKCFDVFLQNWDKFCISSDVEILYNPNISNNQYLFIATIIKLDQYRWGYGRKPKNDKVFETKIKLPVDKDGNPDWEYMENYIKSLPYSKYL